MSQFYDIKKPNPRNWFIPDLGHTIFDADLQQADAQVVAWEANDAELKEIFRDPERDLHNENTLTIFGKLTKPLRQMAKAGVHATNYYCKPFRLAKVLNCTVRQAEAFQDKWFSAHPRIHDWHKRIEHQLHSTRTIRNAFGFEVRFFERLDDLLPEALAWIPQSTVAHVINRGFLRLAAHSEVTPLIQVHDSIVGQFPNSFYPHRDQIREALTVEVPYDDPLYIGSDIKCSRHSWGQCKGVDWTSNETYCRY